jgi:hypothetical protein
MGDHMTPERDRVINVLIGPPGAQGILFKDEDISFKVKSYKASKPNECTVTIANLSTQTIAALEVPGQILQLRAGTGTPGKLFTGEILKRGVVTKNDIPERTTTIKAKDGHRAYRDLNVSKSYPQNTPVATVVQDLISAAQTSDGLVLGLGSVLPADSFPAGWAHNGRWRQALTEILAPREYYWTIQGRVIYILNEASAPPGNVPSINPLAGLIGSPTRTAKGINVVSVLNPAIVAGFALEVGSIMQSGLFRAVVVEHSGGKRGLEWNTSTQCEVIK